MSGEIKLPTANYFITMRIKEITEYNDRAYNAILKLLPQLEPEIKLPSKEFFKSIVEDEGTHFFVCEQEDGEIVGMLTLTTYSIPSGTKFWIEDVVIDESNRGKGYGKELMLHAMKYAESTGARAVDLTSRPIRIAANQLYVDLGFEKRDTNIYRYKVTIPEKP